jgi:4-hydroxy-tetrahydrodipicolinate synthase
VRLSGLIAATVLPFTETGTVDIACYQRFVDDLVGAGVGGLAVNADSGEAMSLWPEERRRVMRAAAEVVAGRVPIVSGVIASFTDHAKQLAEEAAADGADVVMVFPNVHLRGKPLDPQLPVDYLTAIHEASGLPQVAFQLQDALGGVEYDPAGLTSIMRLSFVIAIKESTFDALKFRTTLDLVRSVRPDAAFLSGNDNFLYESLVLGADGLLVGAGSIVTEEQVAMCRAVAERRYDDGALINAKLEPLMRTVFAPPIRDYRARLKEVLVAQGRFANAGVRAPLRSLSDWERRRIRTALDQPGLLDPIAAGER